MKLKSWQRKEKVWYHLSCSKTWVCCILIVISVIIHFQMFTLWRSTRKGKVSPQLQQNLGAVRRLWRQPFRLLLCERERERGKRPKSNQDVEEKEMTPSMCLGFNIKDHKNEILREMAKKVSLLKFCLLFIIIIYNLQKGRKGCWNNPNWIRCKICIFNWAINWQCISQW